MDVDDLYNLQILVYGPYVCVYASSSRFSTFF